MDNLFLVQLKIRYININHNIIILISSYPFISLINCPWLLFHGIILLSFYCIFFDCIYFVDAFSPWNTAPASRPSGATVNTPAGRPEGVALNSCRPLGRGNPPTNRAPRGSLS